MISYQSLIIIFILIVGFEKYIRKNHQKHSPRFIYLNVSIIAFFLGIYLLWGSTLGGTFAVALIIFGSTFAATGVFYFFEGIFSKQKTLKIKIERALKINENNEKQNT